jgi:WD40 repeat protein/tetratricopeptide (TPR) repeat protein
VPLDGGLAARKVHLEEWQVRVDKLGFPVVSCSARGHPAMSGEPAAAESSSSVLESLKGGPLALFDGAGATTSNSSVVAVAMKRMDRKQKEDMVAWRTSLEKDTSKLMAKHSLELQGMEEKIRDTLNTVSRQLTTTAQIRVLDTDIEESSKEARASVDKLADLQERVLKMRQELIRPKQSAPWHKRNNDDLKSTADLIDEELAALVDEPPRDVLVEDLPGMAEAHMQLNDGVRTLPIPGERRPESRGRPVTPATEESLEGPALAKRPTSAGKRVPLETARRFRDAEQFTRDPFSSALVETVRFARAANRSLVAKRARWARVLGKIKDGGRPTPDATRPQPPEGLSFTSPTSTSVALKWKPPTYDGGAPIYDYEIDYQISRKVQISLNRSEYVLESPGVQSTSRWISAFPVAFEGFEITGMFAESELVNVRVRAVNQLGVSDWTPAIPSIKLRAHHPPTPPVHLHIAGVTHDSVTLRWDPPIRPGGRSMKNVRIRFVEDKPNWAAIVASGDIRATVPEQRDILTEWNTEFTVSGLKFKTSYRRFCVQAISDKGDESFGSNVVDQAITLEGTREQQLRWEIADVAGRDEAVIDVVYQGFYQRLGRKRYLQILLRDLERLTGETASVASMSTLDSAPGILAGQSSVEAAMGESADDKMKLDPRDIRPVDSQLVGETLRLTRMRRRQFRMKIESLRRDIDSTAKVIEDLKARRVRLRHALSTAESRLRALKAELMMLSTYKGKFIDSAILHGRMHRHRVKELRESVTEEVDQKMDDIALGKQAIIEGMQREEVLTKKIEVLQETIRERTAAQHEFEKHVVANAGKAKVVARLNMGIVATAFDSLKAHWLSVKRSKDLLGRLVKSYLYGMLWDGLRQWKAATFRQAEAQRRMKDEVDPEDDLIIGKGGRMLQKARQSRELAMSDLSAMLREMKTLDGRLELSELTKEQRTQLLAAGGSERDPTGNVEQLRVLQEEVTARAARSRAKANPKASGHAKAATEDAPAPELKELYHGEPTDAIKALETVDRKLGEQVEMLISQGEAVCGGGGPEAVKKAERVLRRAEYACREHGVPGPLIRVYKALTTAYMGDGRHDLALVHVERWQQSAREASNDLECVRSQEQWGVVLRRWGHHEDAAKRLEIALQRYCSMGEEISQVRVLKELSDLYLVMGHNAMSDSLLDRAHAIEERQKSTISDGGKRLAVLEGKLSGVSIKEDYCLELEAVSPIVPILRVQLKVLENAEKLLRRVSQASEEFVVSTKARLRVIESRYKAVVNSSGGSFDVAALDAKAGMPTGASRPESRSGLSGVAVPKAELLKRLEHEKASLDADLTEAQSTMHRTQVRLSNCEDDLEDLRKHLEAEHNGLATKVYGAAALRCVALNEANFVSNDVLGKATGGIAKLATAVDKVVLGYSLEDGICCNSYPGDSPDDAVGPGKGHLSRVVSIAFFGRTIVTGSTDSTVRIWDVDHQSIGKAEGLLADAASGAGTLQSDVMDHQVNRTLLRASGPSSGVPDSHMPRFPISHPRAPFADSLKGAGCSMILEGHTGAVWSVAINESIVVTGGADQLVLVWRLRDGRLMRKLRGHNATVRTISLEEHAFITGSVEGELRMWDYEGPKRNPAETVTLRRRLVGHTGAITVTSMVGDEVVSAGVDGTVLVWNVDTGEPNRSFPLHKGAVTAMRFDAVKIVTAGADLYVRVTDIISGRVLQEFDRAHKAPIVALQFDLEKLLTVSVDRVAKVWRWEDAEQRSNHREHVIRVGEPIARIAKEYGVTISELMKWNNVSRLAGFYQGQRIIVSEPLERVGMDHRASLEDRRDQLREAISDVAEANVAAAGVQESKKMGDQISSMLKRAKDHAASLD